MKCKNCGKLKRNHYNDEINPVTKKYWCYPIGKFTPKDKEYLMAFEDVLVGLDETGSKE